MRWEDERYCRLYTRDTATWTLLPWQSRCLLPLLIRKMDRAGVIEVLAGEEAAALSSMLGVPADVVETGLAGLIGRKVVLLDGDRLLMPNFLEAQECSQSDKLRKQISREKASKPTTQSQTVTDGHKSSQLVTPSLAVPSLAVPSLKRLAGKKPPAEVDHEHQAIIDALVTDFETTRRGKYGFHARDAAAVKTLRGLADAAEIKARWHRALSLTFPDVNNIYELIKAWNRCARDSPSRAASKGPVDISAMNYHPEAASDF